MSTLTHAQCLENAYRVNWRLADVLDGRQFDPGRRWLPSALSAADHLPFLDEDARRTLTHVEMAAYAHLFGYVEEYIAPLAVGLADAAAADGADASRRDALTQFAAEEVKHMTLFRRLRDRIDAALGFPLERVGGERETAAFVLGKERGAVLLLTAAIEWLTQRHHLEGFSHDGELDPFTRHVFACHWREECQHAQLDHLETLRAFDGLSDAARERAVGDLVALVAGVDGLLRGQAACDLRNAERALGRPFAAGQRGLVLDELVAAKRRTFLVSGLTHPRFVELFAAVTTPAQRARVERALADLFAEPAPLAAAA